MVEEYLQALVHMHHLPLDHFVQAGVVRGRSASDAAHVGIRHLERAYRATKVRPDPLAEFVLGWLRRHPLPASIEKGRSCGTRASSTTRTATSWPS